MEATASAVSIKKEMSPAEAFFKDQSKQDQSRGKYDKIDVPPEFFAKKQTGDDQKLTKKQVDKGLVRLKFIHPLTDSSIFQVFPGLDRIRKCFGGEPIAAKLDVKSSITSGLSEVMKEATKKKSTFRMLQRKAKQLDPKKRDATKMREIMKQWAELNGGDLGLADRLHDIDENDGESANEEEDDQIMNMYADIVGDYKFESQRQKT